MMQSLKSPTTDQLMDAHTDIASIDEPIEIVISNHGTLWINGPACCILRITGIKGVTIRDERKLK